MANTRSDSYRGREPSVLLKHPKTGHEVVADSKAVRKKFESRGYTAGGSTAKTTAKTTRKSTAKKTTARA